MAVKKKETPGITRRMLLAATGAIGLGAVVAGTVTYRRWWDRPPGGGHKALSPEEYDVVQAMAEAWMPASDGEPDISGAEADCGAFVDEVVARMPADQRKLFKLMLHIIDDTTQAIEFAPYRTLSLERRAGHLAVWLKSPIFYHRQGVQAVMALIALGYTSHPDVAPYFAQWFRCGYGR
ncbi:MAG: gluconate 2-dehydrogenase subunit 3 family protein [Alphaproteobacteria bacterium]|nr:gluconate 2-dehydrogenase subunit 3 family protein [Alphaproteobacteria bacterium]